MHPVSPLALPRSDSALDVACVAQSPAIRLFRDRAVAVRPGFVITPENASDVAGICQRLGGLPLAIELAAARTNVLSPRELLARMDHQLPLLTGGPRDQPDRLRTMRNAVAWSYDLLDSGQQQLFRRLAVFSGGLTLGAAEQVVGATASQSPPQPFLRERFAEAGPVDGLCPSGTSGAQTGISSPGEGGRPADQPQPVSLAILDGVSQLIDASLLRPLTDGDAARVGMLETIREFGLEQLAGSGEAAAVRWRHAMWCLDLAESSVLAWNGSQQRATLDRLLIEIDNLRGALVWLRESGETELLLRLTTALSPFWYVQGLGREALRWLDHAVTAGAAARAELRALAQEGRWLHLTVQGRDDLAAEALEEAIALWRRIGDQDTLDRGVCELGITMERRGDFARASELLSEALASSETRGNFAVSALSRQHLSEVWYRLGDNPQALALAEAAVAARRQEGSDVGLVIALVGLAQVFCEVGEFAAARPLLDETMTVCVQIGYQAGLMDALVGFARLAGLAGNPSCSARLLGAAAAIGGQLGGDLAPHDELQRRALNSARASLGDAPFDLAMTAGMALSLASARDEAMTDAAETLPPRVPGEALTLREREVLRFLVAGHSDRESGLMLSISPRTVERHISNILNKIGARSRTALVAQAVRSHLV